MILKETIFVQGRPVRDLLLDSLTRQVSFHPSSSPSLLQERDWSGPDELRQAVIQAYQKKAPVVAGAPKFLPRTTNQTKGGSINAT